MSMTHVEENVAHAKTRQYNPIYFPYKSFLFFYIYRFVNLIRFEDTLVCWGRILNMIYVPKFFWKRHCHYRSLLIARRGLYVELDRLDPTWNRIKFFIMQWAYIDWPLLLTENGGDDRLKLNLHLPEPFPWGSIRNSPE